MRTSSSIALSRREKAHRSLASASAPLRSPAASNLGGNRGLLFSEEKGTIEKFRPWGLPSEAFIAAAGRAMAKRDG